MDVERIIRDIKIQLIIAEYDFALGNTANAEANLLQISDILKYRLPKPDSESE